MGIDYKQDDLEFIVATMHQSSLDFLAPLFAFGNFFDFTILVINQTENDRILISDYPKVRVINSFEKGLSKSRNLAIANAKGKILVITDDDVVFPHNPCHAILKAFNTFPKAAAIAFCVTNSNGRFLKKYSSTVKSKLNSFDIYNIMSVEMVINRETVQKQGIRFDTDFGLGSSFSIGEEAVFLHDLKTKKQQIVFVPEVIVTHLKSTTNETLPFEKKYFALGALYKRIHSKNHFFWLFIKLFFDVKQNKIKISQLFKAILAAKQGRLQFKKTFG